MNHKLTIVSGADMHDIAEQLQRQVQESFGDPDVVSLAMAAASTNPDDITGVHSFVRGTFPYNNDPDILKDRYDLNLGDAELFTAPWVMARDYFDGIILQEDCDSLNALVAALNGVLGYQVRMKLVDTDMDGEIDHLLSEVSHPYHNRWLTVDVVNDYPVLWTEQYSENVILIEI